MTINLSNFFFPKKIGSGAFGNIYLNQDKSVSKKSFDLYDQLQKHKKIYQKDPDHIVKPLSQKVEIIPSKIKDYFNPFNYHLGGFMNKQYKMQYLDPLDGWYTLHKVFKKKMNIEPSIKEKWIQELSKAIKNLHENYITHNDLHTGNVMVNILTGQVKLLDFGLAEQFDKETWDRFYQLEKPLNFEDIHSLKFFINFIKYRNDRENWSPSDLSVYLSIYRK
jgi:serine/threonine protein kinase